jgi:hypothetical protein
LRHVRIEVRDDHLRSENERYRPDEEPGHEQRAADQFENPGDTHERSERRGRARRSSEPAEYPKELLQTMLHEQQPCADAEDRECCRREITTLRRARDDRCVDVFFDDCHRVCLGLGFSTPRPTQRDRAPKGTPYCETQAGEDAPRRKSARPKRPLTKLEGSAEGTTPIPACRAAPSPRAEPRR